MKTQKNKLCANWLIYCLWIGYKREQLDYLQKLWNDNHDELGNMI